MKYYSTRDKAVRMESAEAIKMGLSRDGGLLTPESIPQIDETFLNSLVNARYQERAAKVMGLYHERSPIQSTICSQYRRSNMSPGLVGNLIVFGIRSGK